ncbi:uncharacterized protein LOC103967582 isoform X3 [Pyrus x bretschneideri]|uniref:uncharacterized protein LOC103967582 isoform X3 n=1 Tax=Pyrus x bretschneideri TaxID=225117 RepID=UPI00202E76B1|nr:uncharacterized protein LOC103967582 isoform X3 [Pyrus x bretschneideri]
MSIFGRGTFKFRGMEASLVTNGHKKMISTPWISNLLGLGSPSSIHSLKRILEQQFSLWLGKMWSKSSCFLHTNKIAAAKLVGGFRFATAAVNHYNGSTSRSLFGHGYFFRCQEKIPPNTIKYRQTQGQTYGQCFGLDQRGHPSPYSMDHPKNMAPALFAVEEYNKKKNAKLHFVRVVYARQMLYHGDFIQNVYFDAIDGGVTEMYNARVQSRFGCNMKLISFDGVDRDFDKFDGPRKSETGMAKYARLKEFSRATWDSSDI